MAREAALKTATARTDCAALALLSACVFGCAETERKAPANDAAADSVAADAGTALDAGRTLDAAAVRWASLVDMDGWRRYDAALDPLRSEQPETITCQQSATYVEFGAFEIDTTRCNYALSYTPALRAVPAGTPLHINFLHYDLLAPEPATAHVAILFKDTIQWEETIRIPAPGGAVDAIVTTSVPLDFQDPIRLHLHNHGANTYLLVSLEVPDT